MELFRGNLPEHNYWEYYYYRIDLYWNVLLIFTVLGGINILLMFPPSPHFLPSTHHHSF